MMPRCLCAVAFAAAAIFVPAVSVRGDESAPVSNEQGTELLNSLNRRIAGLEAENRALQNRVAGLELHSPTQTSNSMPIATPTSTNESVFVDDESVAPAVDPAPCDPVDACRRHNGWCLPIGQDKRVTVGMGLRTSFNFIEDGAPNGTSWSDDVDLDNLRLYLNGRAARYLGLEFNTDINNAQGFPSPDELRVLDAIAKIELNDRFNFWIGRFLPPSDRSNLDGPFYLNAWEFPFVQLGYPNIFQGRDDGAAIWGQLGGGVFKWQFGAFKGVEGFPNGEDHLLYAGRLTLNLLDPEPGYYNASTYFGEKRILAIGLAAMHQDDAVGTIATPRDFTGWSLDVLFEMPLGTDGSGGVVTLEGAHYNFDDDDAARIDPAGLFTPTTRQGQSFFVLGSYLMPWSLGCGPLKGRLQPYVRFQHYDRDFPAALAPEEQWDLGVHYVIDGHNARLTSVWEHRDQGPGTNHIDLLRFGVQVQY